MNLYQSMLASVIFARDKWLKPGGLILPSHATVSFSMFIYYSWGICIHPANIYISHSHLFMNFSFTWHQSQILKGITIALIFGKMFMELKVSWVLSILVSFSYAYFTLVQIYFYFLGILIGLCIIVLSVSSMKSLAKQCAFIEPSVETITGESVLTWPCVVSVYFVREIFKQEFAIFSGVN